MVKLFSWSYDYSQFHNLIKDKITLFQILLGVYVCNDLQYLGLIRNKLPLLSQIPSGAMSPVLVGTFQNTEAAWLISTGENVPEYCHPILHSALPTSSSFSNSWVFVRDWVLSLLVSLQTKALDTPFWFNLWFNTHASLWRDWTAGKKRVWVIFLCGSVHTLAFVSQIGVCIRITCRTC